jgi:hypothetical protein
LKLENKKYSLISASYRDNLISISFYYSKGMHTDTNRIIVGFNMTTREKYEYYSIAIGVDMKETSATVHTSEQEPTINEKH